MAAPANGTVGVCKTNCDIRSIDDTETMGEGGLLGSINIARCGHHQFSCFFSSHHMTGNGHFACAQCITCTDPRCPKFPSCTFPCRGRACRCRSRWWRPPRPCPRCAWWCVSRTAKPTHSVPFASYTRDTGIVNDTLELQYLTLYHLFAGPVKKGAPPEKMTNLFGRLVQNCSLSGYTMIQSASQKMRLNSIFIP